MQKYEKTSYFLFHNALWHSKSPLLGINFQFVDHLGERVLTWGRRVPASVFACQGSMPWQANALLFKALPCWGLEPQHGNTDAGTRRPQVRIRPPIRQINCSLSHKISIRFQNLWFIFHVSFLVSCFTFQNTEGALSRSHSVFKSLPQCF